MPAGTRRECPTRCGLCRFPLFELSEAGDLEIKFNTAGCDEPRAYVRLVTSNAYCVPSVAGSEGWDTMYAVGAGNSLFSVSHVHIIAVASNQVRASKSPPAGMAIGKAVTSSSMDSTYKCCGAWAYLVCIVVYEGLAGGR